MRQSLPQQQADHCQFRYASHSVVSKQGIFAVLVLIVRLFALNLTRYLRHQASKFVQLSAVRFHPLQKPSHFRHALRTLGFCSLIFRAYAKTQDDLAGGEGVLPGVEHGILQMPPVGDVLQNVSPSVVGDILGAEVPGNVGDSLARKQRWYAGQVGADTGVGVLCLVITPNLRANS
jgi:hypothetical protein